MKLAGPIDITRTFAVDGGLLRLSGGKAMFHPDGAEAGTEEIPDAAVPDNVFGLGFVKVDEQPAEVMVEKPAKSRHNREE